MLVATRGGLLPPHPAKAASTDWFCGFAKQCKVWDLRSDNSIVFFSLQGRHRAWGIPNMTFWELVTTLSAHTTRKVVDWVVFRLNREVHGLICIKVLVTIYLRLRNLFDRRNDSRLIRSRTTTGRISEIVIHSKTIPLRAGNVVCAHPGSCLFQIGLHAFTFQSTIIN